MELALERTELPQSALYVCKARLNELAGPIVLDPVVWTRAGELRPFASSSPETLDA